MSFINYNGLICLNDESAISFHSRALRHGEGLIETMFFMNDSIRLFELHYERLSNSLSALNFPAISIFDFEKELAKTIVANQYQEKGILRAHFFMTEALHELQFWIEMHPVKKDHELWKVNHLEIGVSKNIRKSYDSISHLKHSSRLPYLMAKQEAIANNWDDILITNTSGNMVESTIANLFIVKDDTIFTPPLTDGCVAGVMRQYLLHKGEIAGMPVKEQSIDAVSLANADEVFLTNAVRGLQPVGSINKMVYPTNTDRIIFDEIAVF